ncbi:MAG: DUF1122 family protein [Deltaproteobacteria bacterium]|nr:DUF1122 family protein [Deltaproteobacteria bacterium]
MIPIQKLHNKSIGPFRISVTQIKPLKLHGWFGFELKLFNSKGEISKTPVAKGIYSKGRGSEIAPWIDFNLRQKIQWPRGEINLRCEGLLTRACREISKVIPPGGHLMVSYEDPFPLHQETAAALSKGIPPILSPLGRILFECGFVKIKDWYLSESGHEGPRKLWAEKPPDKSWEKAWHREVLDELDSFLGKKRKRSLHSETLEFCDVMRYKLGSELQ